MRLGKSERPGGDSGAFEDHQGAGSIPIVAVNPDDLTYYGRALVVLVEDKNGKYRRRLYLSLRSAERAVERANARGADARLVLCRLEPVEGGEGL